MATPCHTPMEERKEDGLKEDWRQIGEVVKKRKGRSIGVWRGMSKGVEDGRMLPALQAVSGVARLQG
jgi:hypothetical protein